MIIRDIRKDPHSDLYLGKMHSELFDRDIDVILHGNDTEYLDYAEKCAGFFNDMPEELLDLLKQYSLRYCEDMREYFDPGCFDVPEGVTVDTVLEYARVNCLIIERPANRGMDRTRRKGAVCGRLHGHQSVVRRQSV